MCWYKLDSQTVLVKYVEHLFIYVFIFLAVLQTMSPLSPQQVQDPVRVLGVAMKMYPGAFEFDFRFDFQFALPFQLCYACSFPFYTA